jgi:hypothetical protein
VNPSWVCAFSIAGIFAAGVWVATAHCFKKLSKGF